MKRMALPLILIAVLALSACGSSITINSDFDDSQDFTQYKTFRYAKPEELNPGDALQTSPFVGNRVKAAIEENLVASGFTQLEGDEADFVILAHGGVQEKMSVTNWSASYGYGGYYGGWYDPWWGPYGGNTTVSYYDEATLVIDVVDTERQELVWRGMATGTLATNPSPEKQEANIRNAVAQIMARFPPQ